MRLQQSKKLILENSVSITITPAQWKQYWKVVNKGILLYESGLHFGHYIVGSKSNIISHYHAARVAVTLPHAVQVERWSRGLLVMLEKTLGLTLVTKLRAILLMEGNFNATNKIVYGVWMMRNAWGHHLIPRRYSARRIVWPTMGRCAKGLTKCTMNGFVGSLFSDIFLDIFI
jgi:hypothetical protein